MNATSTKIGNQGASSNAIRPWPVINCRSVAKSMSTCAGLALCSRRLRAKAASKIRSPKASSSPAPMRIITTPRTHSIRALNINRPRAMKVSMNNVVSLRLVSTRSYTCIM
ncbi:hypothetical protein D3C76_1053560 [compost metagenome]